MGPAFSSSGGEDFPVEVLIIPRTIAESEAVGAGASKEGQELEKPLIVSFLLCEKRANQRLFQIKIGKIKMTNSAKKTYIANFGTVANLRITQSRGVPMAAFTLDGGEKFSRDVVVFGAERVEKMKEIGNGRKAWVRGEITEITKRNANGGTYKVTGLKGYNLKDITDAQPKAKAADAAEAKAAAEEASSIVRSSRSQVASEPA